jgi:hypothetical protein
VVAKEAGKKWTPFGDREFKEANSWGQIEQAMDSWAQPRLLGEVTGGSSILATAQQFFSR